MPQELINQLQGILNSVLGVLQIIATFLIAFLVVLWLTLCFWTFRDIQSRTNDVLAQVFATLLVVFFNIPGVLLYVLVRPKTTLAQLYEANLQEEYMLQDLEEREICPTCRVKSQPDFMFCFNCRTRLRRECPNCGQIVKVKWSNCPYCSFAIKPKSREAAVERAALATRATRPTKANPTAGQALTYSPDPNNNLDLYGSAAADAGQNPAATGKLQAHVPDNDYRPPDPPDEDGGEPTIPGDENPYARYMPQKGRKKKD
jgi:Double zinc ribbon